MVVLLVVTEEIKWATARGPLVFSLSDLKDELGARARDGDKVLKIDCLCDAAEATQGLVLQQQQLQQFACTRHIQSAETASIKIGSK
ncbi:hypothetical protein PoB_000878300 [Plakobranchus ocellatus]|uniref:Uncharacterized protein n=1 Tax=Plakobranchus ocellatus TaxID=259542 RepID=A0AAV3YID6_9GAST|nr:hypothetical protein PoB_000878300 [Plakobranchus ocellatus]